VLEQFFKADCPLIQIFTADPIHAEQKVREAFEAVSMGSVYFMTKGGLECVDGGRDPLFVDDDFIIKALRKAPCAVITYNLKGGPGLIEFYRKARGKHAHIVNIGMELPKGAETLFVSYELPPPTEEEIVAYIKDGFALDKKTAEEIARELVGLSLTEVESITAIYLVKNDPEILRTAKEKIIHASRLLNTIRSDVTLSDIGGLPRLKKYIEKVKFYFKNFGRLRKLGLKPPRGMLLSGWPGTGKTLSAKAVANELGRPLLHLNIGALLNPYIGNSESNLRQALSTIERVGECVVLIDEVEKELSGYNSMGNPGVMARMLSQLLFFMQETQAPVFFIFTANDFTRIPTELLRAGRLDKIFFLDAPFASEREEIIKIKLKALNLPKAKRDQIDVEALVAVSESLTGAEIEQAINDGILDAIMTKRANLTQAISDAMRKITPVVQMDQGTYALIKEKGYVVIANEPCAD